MNNFILLLVSGLFSFVFAQQFGDLYFGFSQSQGGGSWVGADDMWAFIIGFPVAYTFFTTFLFQTFASGNRNKWTGWLLAPALLFFAAGDLRHFYFPIALVAVGLVLAWLVRKVIAKFRHHNLPMVINK